MKFTKTLLCGACVASSQAATVIAWESDFDTTTDYNARGGATGTTVAAPAGFTGAVGNVLEVNLNSATASRWGSLEPSVGGDGTGGSLNIDIAALGVQPGDAYTFKWSFYAPSGAGFDAGDSLGAATIRWNSTATPGFIPNNGENGIPTSFIGQGTTTPGEVFTRTVTGTVPAGTTHAFPLLSLSNTDELSANYPGVYGYYDNVELSFEVVPEPSSVLALCLSGLLAFRRRR